MEGNGSQGSSSAAASASAANEGKIVKLKGLPFKASVEDIVQFFDGFQIQRDMIWLKRRPDGRPFGEAFVTFENREEAERATSKDRETFSEKFGVRYVRVYPTLESDLPDIRAAASNPHYAGNSVIKVKSLPYDATQLDVIQFFSDYRLRANGVQLVVRSDNGKPSGEAFVDFESHDEAMRAVREKDRNVFNEKFGDRFVRLIHVSRKEMEATLAWRFGGEGILKMKGIPWKATTADIVKFFQGYRIKSGGISFIMHPDGRPTGMAFVELETPQEAIRALEKDRAVFSPAFGNRYCMLQLVSRHEMERANVVRGDYNPAPQGGVGGNAAMNAPGMKGLTPVGSMMAAPAQYHLPSMGNMGTGMAPGLGDMMTNGTAGHMASGPQQPPNSDLSLAAQLNGLSLGVPGVNSSLGNIWLHQHVDAGATSAASGTAPGVALPLGQTLPGAMMRQQQMGAGAMPVRMAPQMAGQPQQPPPPPQQQQLPPPPSQQQVQQQPPPPPPPPPQAAGNGHVGVANLMPAHHAAPPHMQPQPQGLEGAPPQDPSVIGSQAGGGMVAADGSVLAGSIGLPAMHQAPFQQHMRPPPQQQPQPMLDGSGVPIMAAGGSVSSNGIQGPEGLMGGMPNTHVELGAAEGSSSGWTLEMSPHQTIPAYKTLVAGNGVSDPRIWQMQVPPGDKGPVAAPGTPSGLEAGSTVKPGPLSRGESRGLGILPAKQTVVATDSQPKPVGIWGGAPWSTF